MQFLFKILHVMGRNTCLCKEEMCFILLGGASFSFLFLYTGLMTIFTYIMLIFDIYMMMYVFFTYLYMCCFFSFFIHMVLITCMQSIISVSHKDALMSFVVFQKYRLSKSTCHKLSSCKVFQEFVLGQILLYSTSEYELSDL